MNAKLPHTVSPRASILDATRSYEAWLGRQTPVLPGDLERKHEKMDASAFTFMRATFYRWSQTFPTTCPELTEAPSVLAVGDLHVNNFGLWRDAEGRLAWGVNDFDEAHPLSYTNDLVRLALSAALLDQETDLDICLDHACEAILKGYSAGLRKGGRAFVLAERNDWIRELALARLVHPDRFWSKLEQLPAANADEVPAEARSALEAMLPARGIDFRVVRRVAGAGSLGRPRFVALAEWTGGRVAREAKAIVPSACVWSTGGTGAEVHYDAFFERAVRAPDPWVSRRGSWIVRRLAPDCTRIELHSLPNRERAQAKLLKAMGREVANVHRVKDPGLGAVREDLERRDPDWLKRATHAMVKSVLADWEDWRARGAS